MKKPVFWISIAISFLLVIGIPFFIDWCVIGNTFPSNISNSDWVGFLGGYIGAIIGAMFSLIGIAWTIKFTREENKSERELQVRPYCSIKYVHDDKLVGTNKIIAELPIGCMPQGASEEKYTSILYIKNIGLGPAIEFDFKVDEIDDRREHYPILMQRDSNTDNRRVNLLQPNEEAAFPIYIYFNFDPIEEKDFIEISGSELFRYTIKHEILTKYKNFDIVIHMRYSDMYHNQYYQKIVLYSNMYAQSDNDKKCGKHLCDIHVKEISDPVKCAKKRNEKI